MITDLLDGERWVDPRCPIRIQKTLRVGGYHSDVEISPGQLPLDVAQRVAIEFEDLNWSDGVRAEVWGWQDEAVIRLRGRCGEVGCVKHAPQRLRKEINATAARLAKLPIMDQLQRPDVVKVVRATCDAIAAMT